MQNLVIQNMVRFYRIWVENIMLENFEFYIMFILYVDEIWKSLSCFGLTPLWCLLRLLTKDTVLRSGETQYWICNVFELNN